MEKSRLIPKKLAEEGLQNVLKYEREFGSEQIFQVELVGWKERRGSVQSSIITRTTHYDASQGGFVTEVDIVK